MSFIGVMVNRIKKASYLGSHKSKNEGLNPWLASLVICLNFEVSSE